MKKLRLWGTALLLFAVLIAAARLTFVASNTESGWGFIATQWQDAAFGLFGLGHTLIGDKAPVEQATFWLSEVDRVIAEYPESASVHMGAAWVLDSPGTGFQRDLWRRRYSFVGASPSARMEPDLDAISAATDKFREKCVKRCLELAERATQLEPADVRWWRMRALLQFEGHGLWTAEYFKPRNADWLEVLDECKKHDPENALYDYLAALQLWNASASYDWPVEPDDESAYEIDEPLAGDDSQGETDVQEKYWILTVEDTDGFALATKRFGSVTLCL